MLQFVCTQVCESTVRLLTTARDGLFNAWGFLDSAISMGNRFNMRKITSLLLATLLTVTFAAGSVAAKPKDDNPGNGAVTIPFKVNQNHEYGGDWRCTGNYVVNKNRDRIHVECKVSDVASLPVGPGTYSSATHDISTEVGMFSGQAGDVTGIPVPGNWEDWTWTVTVKATGNGSGHVSGVAVLD